ncbi:unnamed protein product [Echinostoma caproni]|uniref:PHD domain-containing protein n=1 Tax=Echinostoma caproni TaxID=27848 RepID=A0A183B6D0_9TREM|nr:unnamed protein product [Echinostoma caproni]
MLPKIPGRWPDIQLLCCRPGMSYGVLFNRDTDLDKLFVDFKYLGKKKTPQTNAGILPSVASTSHQPSTTVVRNTVAKRKPVLEARPTNEKELVFIGDPVQGLDFRCMRTLTSRMFKLEAKRRLLQQPTSAIHNQVCSICRLDEPQVDLDEEIQWVQCFGCQRWTHFKCTGFNNGEKYLCMHYLSRWPRWDA